MAYRVRPPPHAGQVTNSTRAGRRFKIRAGRRPTSALKTTPVPRHFGQTSASG